MSRDDYYIGKKSRAADSGYRYSDGERSRKVSYDNDYEYDRRRSRRADGYDNDIDDYEYRRKRSSRRVNDSSNDYDSGNGSVERARRYVIDSSEKNAKKRSTGSNHKKKSTNSSKAVKSKKKQQDGLLMRFIRKAFLLVILVLCVYLAACAILLRGLNVEKVDTGWDDMPPEQTSDIGIKRSSDVTTILLIGADADKGGGSRSDTMIIAGINTRSKSIKLCSILRDNYVQIPGHKSRKINASHVYGGAALTMQTIESNFRVRIDKYVEVNMDSMEAIVDAVGGVELTLSKAEANAMNKHFHAQVVSQGTQHLSGRYAVYYSRIRKIDDDFKRTGRQRILLNAIMDKCRSLKYTELIAIVDDIVPHLTTNMSRVQLASTALDALPAAKNGFEEMTIPAEGTFSYERINGESCIRPDIRKNTELLHEFLYG